MSTTTTAYGSITIVDITDVGEFSIQPMSNSPLTVIYDPNEQDSPYNPNWETAPVTLTPIIYYAGQPITEMGKGVTVDWYYRYGSSGDTRIDPENLDAGYEVDGFKLIISKRKLDASERKDFVTYTCIAKYNNTTEGITDLQAVGQITFSLIQNASKLKRCSIAGTNIFKYNSSLALQGAGFIPLTVKRENVGVGKWQYLNNGQYKDYPVISGHNTSNTSDTLNVYPDERASADANAERIFSGDSLTIKYVSEDTQVYDIFTITKLYDGTPGSNNLAVVLDNEDQVVPVKHLDSGTEQVDYSLAMTSIKVYDGPDPISIDTESTPAEERTGWTISIQSSQKDGADTVTYNYDEDTQTCSVTNMTEDTGYVDFIVMYEDTEKARKRFTITKVVTGRDGVSPTIYSLISDTLVVHQANTDSVGTGYNVDTVTFYAYQYTGQQKSAYDGHMKATITLIDGTTVIKNSGTTKASTFSVGLTGYQKNIRSIACELYEDSTITDTVLDRQSVAVTRDGDKGESGNDGAAAINIVLGNVHENIPCDAKGAVANQMEIRIPVFIFEGTDNAGFPFKVTSVTGVPTDFTLKTAINTWNTSGVGTSLVFGISKGADLDDKQSGEIQINLRLHNDGGPMASAVFSWNKTIAGDDAILMRIVAPEGNFIVNGDNNVTLMAEVYRGSSPATSSSFKWFKYTNGSYEEVGSEAQLTVTPGMVQGYASFRCEATVDGKSYTQYYAVYDKTDPLQVTVVSTLGTQILNGCGVGAVYTKVMRNGTEIDPLLSERFLQNNNPETGNGYYYYVDASSSPKTVTLRRHNGSTWENANHNYTYDYTYTFRDQNGDETSYNGKNEFKGRILYIDADIVDKKIVIDVKVETKTEAGS